MMKGQRGLNTEFVLSRSAWTDREKKPVKGDGVRRAGREKGEEEITGASNNRGKVDFVNILSIARGEGFSQSGNGRGEIEENETQP